MKKVIVMLLLSLSMVITPMFFNTTQAHDGIIKDSPPKAAHDGIIKDSITLIAHDGIIKDSPTYNT
ncbi:hypothetical protein [Bacillus sp. Marseille-Q3570]|uniref:hypothetical protein n=1 Tax=Bacillus sp. Marseille-Q3570 TaxID=2963522 RepID=UPI0021B6F290|nr:hypothetical protein [Bacillus sp. Marseille-Q3570]